MTRRSVLPISILFLLLSSARLSAQDYKLALGLRLSTSSPTLNNSVTGKYFMSDKHAVEGLIAFGSRFGVGALYEVYRPFESRGFSWFYGGGAYFGVQEKQGYAGPTGIAGLNYNFQQVPINLSLDWKPELDIAPAVHFVPDAFGLSVRFTLR